MRIYLVQHGEAVPKAADPQRPLSADGAGAVRRVAGFLRPLGLSVGAVWHSGKARACQTAEILAPALAAEHAVARREGLGPKDPVHPVARAIETADQDLMVVGHLPFLSRLCARLVAEDEDAGVVAFQYGAVACLDRHAELGWAVRWMLPPALLQPA
jgi:phosphohistidine phosphatase